MAGDLVILNNVDEINQVKSKLPGSNNYWIGITDSDVEGTWKWIDGSTPNITDWNTDSSEPTGDGNCAFLCGGRSYRWNDAGCGITNRYVCELPGNVIKDLFAVRYCTLLFNKEPLTILTLFHMVSLGYYTHGGHI